jgi:hypothetical protein
MVIVNSAAYSSVQRLQVVGRCRACFLVVCTARVAHELAQTQVEKGWAVSALPCMLNTRSGVQRATYTVRHLHHWLALLCCGPTLSDLKLLRIPT